jgi:hypothetical protein
MKYAKIEKLGVTHEGPDVVLVIEGREIRMPWQVAQLLANQIGKHAIESRAHDMAFMGQLKEITYA